MELYFKDRIPDQFQGQNQRFYDAVDTAGTVKLPDFKLVMKNNIPAGREGTPLSAGNLNFASGNVSLPSAGDARKGNLLSLAHGIAAPSKTKRATAAAGPDASVASHDNGFLRLADTKLLIIYNDRMVVATVDFTGKTVSFGNYFTAPGNYQLNTLSLLRSFDDSPIAVVCGLSKDTSAPNAYRPVLYRIDGADNITALQSGSSLSSYYDSTTNMVRVSNSEVLICAKDYSTLYITMFNINTETYPYFTQEAQITVPGLDIVNSYLYNMLFSYDVGKYMLIYGWSNFYALPISVSGNVITAGSAQLLGTMADTLTNVGYMPGGTDRFTVKNGKIILNSSTIYLPAKIQVLSVDSAGTVTKGAIYNTPLSYIYGGTSCITYKDGKIYLTGVDRENLSAFNGCLLEIGISGTSANITKYSPFMSLNAPSETTASYIRSAAYENPNNPGEFLFMQGFNAAPLTNVRFWFGYKSDDANPNNIIGIAIEDAANGYVRVQATGKHLPGIFSGLTAGQLYGAGDNGSLTPSSGGNAVGIAVSQNDLLFFGARGL